MELTDNERELLHDAVVFYLDRVEFATGDEAEGTYRDLLDRLVEDCLLGRLAEAHGGSHMKMTYEDFEMLRGAIIPLDTTERRERYRAGNFPRAHLVRNLDRRYRWDLFAQARVSFLSLNYQDAHIETALRRIIKPLDTPEGPDSPRHNLHTTRVGLDGINRCECGDTWPNQIGQSPLDSGSVGPGS